MHYTIFELERIEKVLQAKLAEAREAANNRAQWLHNTWREKLNGTEEGRSYDAPRWTEAWEKHKAQDMDLQLLMSEVALFEEGINALYSYWNSAVEIFIDNMRTRTEERVKQP